MMVKEKHHRLFQNHCSIFHTGNNDKFRQVQAIHQQILQFITNPTIETLNNAKHFRDMLERIPVIKQIISRSFHPYRSI